MLVAALLFGIFVSAASAPADDIAPLPEEPAALDDCTIGTTRQTGYVLQSDERALASIHVEPSTECSCPVGTDYLEITASIYTDQRCTIEVVGRLRGPDLSDPSCPRPGEILCESAVTSRYLDDDGVHFVTTALDCACAAVAHSYFLEFEILGGDCDFITGEAHSGTTFGFVVSREGDACNAYFNGVPAGTRFPNIETRFAIRAATACCDQPVGDSGSSFGALKANQLRK